MVISDCQHRPRALVLERLQRCCERARSGTVLVQLRDKELGIRERLSLGERLRDITRSFGQHLSVNDRLDLARLVDADALHLGELAVATAAVRAHHGRRFWISRAWHPVCRQPHLGPDALAVSPGCAPQPDLDADALIVSPVCAPRKQKAALGLSGLRQAAGMIDAGQKAPAVYALGGVDDRTAPDCLALGISGVAVMGAVLDHDDPDPLLMALEILRK